MIKLFIPTYNRSYKLARVLKAYSLWQDPPEIFIYDGSDNISCADANHKIATSYRFVRYSHNILPLFERFLCFLEDGCIEDIFFIANDEDVYLESFCKSSFDMMSECKSLSAVVGSYLTFCPPLVSSAIPRLSIKKLIPRGFTLTGSSLEKISTHISLNQTSKLPPLFYSAQRISDFKQFVNLLVNSKLKFSSAELLHQFNLLDKGDVAFIPKTMLLRDETRINYKRAPNHQGQSAYIESQEVEKIFNMVLGRSSDLSTYLNCIFSPSIEFGTDGLAKDKFLRSYLTPITQMVFSYKIFIRYPFRLFQAFCIRAVSVVNAFILLLVSPVLSRAVRYFVIRTLFLPLPAEDRFRPKS